jgi:hypothetical protein
MSITDDFLAEADIALAAGLTNQGSEPLEVMTRFMQCFEQFAHAVVRREADWDQATPWAIRNAERLCATRPMLSDWDLETGRIFYSGGEEAAERALRRRSQFALVRELFRDTAAEEMLVGYDSHDVDHDFRAQADRLALQAPDWVPRSHTWWSWRED